MTDAASPDRVRHGDRVRVLKSPDPSAIGKVGTVVVREGWTFVDLGDGTGRFPLLLAASLLPAPKTAEESQP